MLVKQVKGRDFYGCLAYIMGKVGARPLDSNMQATTPEGLSHEFQNLDVIRQQVQRRVYHCALSLPIGEHLNDHDWRKLGKDFLEQMGFADHQYVLVQHTDRPHEHVHIIANRVGLDGAVVEDSWDYTKAEAVARRLETEYGLQPLASSWATDRKALSHRQLEAERKTGQPCIQRQLQDGLDHALPECHDLNELMTGLAHQEIHTKITYGYQNQPIGISYTKAGVTMSGSNLGKRYTLEALNQHFQEQALEQELTLKAPLANDAVQAVRTQIIDTLDRLTENPLSLSELIEQLAQEDIAVHLKFGRLRQEKQQVKAITYSHGNITFPGQSLGEQYHLVGLQEHLGVSYDPQRDTAWFKAWRNRKVAPIEPAHSVARSIIFASSPVQKRFSQSLRDRMIGWLNEEIMTAFQQAQDSGYDKLQVITTAAPGIEQWGAVTALKLREAQKQGEIAVIPMIEVIALTRHNLAEQWNKQQKHQYDRILRAVDRIDHTSEKINYLADNSLILGNADSLKPTEQIMIQKAQSENITVRIQASQNHLGNTYPASNRET